jgi:hypothetical protein
VKYVCNSVKQVEEGVEEEEEEGDVCGRRYAAILEEVLTVELSSALGLVDLRGRELVASFKTQSTVKQENEEKTLMSRSKCSIGGKRIAHGKRSVGRKPTRLRSRNKIIDDWLGDEDGSDGYADLEDFIVA